MSQANEQGTFRSPDEVLAAAKDAMLEGREPETEQDWAKIVNFMAANIHEGTRLPAIQLICKLYDIPLSEGYIENIVAFQSLPAEDQKLLNELMERLGNMTPHHLDQALNRIQHHPMFSNN